MKTKILSIFGVILLTILTVSMIPEKSKAPNNSLLAPGLTCPYPVRNLKSCPVKIYYEFRDAANNQLPCFGNLTIPANGVVFLPCCTGAANLFIKVTQIGSVPVTQLPGMVNSGLLSAGGSFSGPCGPSFNVNWSYSLTVIN